MSELRQFELGRNSLSGKLSRSRYVSFLSCAGFFDQSANIMTCGGAIPSIRVGFLDRVSGSWNNESWAGLFRGHILPELLVHKIASCYTDGFGRPTKEIYAALGALILQQMHDLTDEETVSQYSFNLQWHYALDIPGETDEAKYLCAKTLWSLRHMVAEEGLDRELFNATTETLTKVFKVKKCSIWDGILKRSAGEARES